MMKSISNVYPDLKPMNDFEIHQLTYDSRDVKSGDIFIAIKGLNYDGNEFINEAFSKGAKAAFSEAAIINDERIYKVEDCRKFLSVASNAFYEYPSNKLFMIGVTGTNGKTTVSNLINFALKCKGEPTGLIGTNGYFINEEKVPSEFTTPESVDLNRLLNQMVNKSVKYVTLEVSSHALALKRVYGIDFDMAIFTNLTPEHLDFHKDMKDYFESKKKLFNSLKKINSKGNKTVSIFNSDDLYGKEIISEADSELISYGFSNADFTVMNLDMNFQGMHFDMIIRENNTEQSLKISSALTGKFNVYNILASTAALKKLGFKTEEMIAAINNFEHVEGRFNQYVLQNGAIAIIDYSHTSDSLKNALLTIKEILEINKSKGKIITVFGCGGNRDKTKRPLMGKIASDLSDRVIITSDNPRYENPNTIIDEIAAGAENSNFEIEVNRKDAIKKAIKISEKDDVILIAGKGHEDYQIIEGKKLPFSDREIVLKYCR